MSGIERGLARAAGLLALGWLLPGCSSKDVAAGSEGDAVNLGRCFEADCGAQGQALSAEAPEVAACGDVVGQLQDPQTFEPIAPGVRGLVLDAKEAPDGSVWALQSVTDVEQGNASFYLTHHRSDGVLLGVSDAIDSEAEHTHIDAALALDPTGNVTVAVYSIYAETADSELVERLTLHSFDGDLTPVGAPRAFRGLATPHMAGGPLGSIWLAGNATNNAPHGAISRLTGGEPDWIQTALTTSGQGVGGVSALTVADDGFAAVVARLNPKWEAGPNVDKLGISSFDAEGNPLWSLTLPTDYAQGYGGALGGRADGSLVVAGVVGERGDLLVQGVSRDGVLGWSYRVEQAVGPSVEVRRESGRTFIGTFQGLAVIDRDGTSCRRFSGGFTGIAVEGAEPTDATSAPWRADAEYVFAVGGELTRFRVPE